MSMLAHSFVTDFGTFTAVEDGGVLVSIKFGEAVDIPTGKTEVLSETEKQIQEYLSGGRREFDLPFSHGKTGFSETVLDVLYNTQYGETVTYKRLAELSGSPNAYRAVGTICRKNPLPIIIPCHRVIPSSGGTGEYAGTPELKRRLLDLESQQLFDVRD